MLSTIAQVTAYGCWGAASPLWDHVGLGRDRRAGPPVAHGRHLPGDPPPTSEELDVILNGLATLERLLPGAGPHPADPA